ncbi:MAG: phage tail protein I [Parvularculales bacterium]
MTAKKDKLMPPSATPQENALSNTIAERFKSLPVDIKKLWNIKECPASFLSVLAWSLKTDIWDEAWTERQKRSVCAFSPNQHAIKGSRKSLEQVAEPIGGHAAIKEWWEQSPPEEPYTFRITVSSSAKAGTDIQRQEVIQKLLDIVTPLRSRYILDIGTDFNSDLFLKSFAQSAKFSSKAFCYPLNLKADFKGDLFLKSFAQSAKVSSKAFYYPLNLRADFKGDLFLKSFAQSAKYSRKTF